MALLKSDIWTLLENKRKELNKLEISLFETDIKVNSEINPFYRMKYLAQFNKTYRNYTKLNKEIKTLVKILSHKLKITTEGKR